MLVALSPSAHPGCTLSSSGVAPHKGFVRPRYDAHWYARNKSSCIEKAGAFAVATCFSVMPVMVLLQVRHARSLVALRSALWRASLDTGGAAAVSGAFIASYCSLNNVMGAASSGTAMASAALSGMVLGSIFARSNPWNAPKMGLGGAVLAYVVWHGTWVLQTMAEEKQ